MPNSYRGGSQGAGYAQSSKPSLGFTVSEPHRRAMGHFAQEKFMREGHNTVGGAGSARAKSRAVTGLMSGGNKVTVTRRGKAGKAIAKTVGIEKLGRKTARRAIKAGGAAGAAIAAAKPKLAKRIARRNPTVRTAY